MTFMTQMINKDSNIFQLQIPTPSVSPSVSSPLHDSTTPSAEALYMFAFHLASATGARQKSCITIYEFIALRLKILQWIFTVLRPETATLRSKIYGPVLENFKIYRLKVLSVYRAPWQKRCPKQEPCTKTPQLPQ
jgi:hypothetical protein